MTPGGGIVGTIANTDQKNFIVPQENRPKYMIGAPKSINRLKHLNFDPIGELVNKYKELDGELERQKEIRAGKIVELTAAGKPKSHNPEIMLSIFDKQIAIAEKLLRYRYGRVPESGDDRPPIPGGLVVHLTKKGETYVVQDEQPDGDFQDDDTD